ncbi:MAG: hypothetical protein SFU83_06295 [Meiothermus sp.]|nr:hypothetical protein [Meiothermus sp.]
MSDEWFNNLELNYENIITIWPGKELLKEVRRRLSEDHGIDITDGAIISSLKEDHVSEEIKQLVSDLGQKFIADS